MSSTLTANYTRMSEDMRQYRQSKRTNRRSMKQKIVLIAILAVIFVWTIILWDLTADIRADNAMLAQVTFTKLDATHAVGCPMAAMSTVVRARWVQYAAERNWYPYPAAGRDCVDP